MCVVLACLLLPTAPAAADGAPREAAQPRVVSFSPALTRILFDTGLGNHVVGVTRFCRLPEGVERPRVADALRLDADAVLATRPDVLLTQSNPQPLRAITQARPSVRIVQVRLDTLGDVGAAIERVAVALGRPTLGRRRRAVFEAQMAFVRARTAEAPRRRVLFVLGTTRPTVAGPGSFLGDLIATAGGVNAANDLGVDKLWIETELSDIAQVRPDVIVCHAPAAQAERTRAYWLRWRSGERALPAAREGRVYVVSDDDWLRPSTRLAELAMDLARRVHPEQFAGEALPEARGGGAAPGVQWLWRLLAAALVGAALGAGGAALQGLLRNPLAEPYILGVSSGAGVGVLLGLALASWTALPDWASTPALAFGGALGTCAVVYLIAQRRGRLDAYALILSGVIVNAFNGAVMLAIFLYVDPYRIADFVNWAMGRLEDTVDRTRLAVCGACVLAGWALLALRGPALNVLGLGDDVAASSGVRVHRLRVEVFAAVGLMTAAAVSLAGPIGFLGLIVPHLCRMFVGASHRRLLLISGAVGALLLAGADMLCRRIGPLIGAGVVPVGIVTALAGGPFFLVLLRRRRGEGAP